MSALLWVRRDPRVQDNPALISAIKAGADKAVFISTPGQWHSHHLAPVKADLIRRHLEQFSSQLVSLGIELVHLKGDFFEDQASLLVGFCRDNHIDQVFANREPETDEHLRDSRVSNSGIKLELYDTETIAPAGRILNQQGKMFRSFTPFKNAWLKYVREAGIECVTTPLGSQDAEVKQKVEINLDYPLADSDHWPLSEKVIKQLLPDFLSRKLAFYSQQRDFPAIKGTSELSPYLAIGTISPRWLATQLISADPEVLYNTGHFSFSWLNELIWRDFYKHLLHHFPDLIKGQSFQLKYQHLNWCNRESDFNAWCTGKTGYPIVDAAMRQLLKTGWMHNRLRMITASFLTKHLLIDWRWGERFFMSHLIDGDFCANNGGWQWVAGTGCDAQPYFRIFNPITQSQKFDPKGAFIRRYLPELANVPDNHIHFPHDYLEKSGMQALYWPALVEHKFARQRALAFYKG